MNNIKTDGNPSRNGKYLTAMQNGKRGFAVNYYHLVKNKWYTHPEGVNRPDQYERKSVTHWSELPNIEVGLK